MLCALVRRARGLSTIQAHNHLHHDIQCSGVSRAKGRISVDCTTNTVYFNSFIYAKETSSVFSNFNYLL